MHRLWVWVHPIYIFSRLRPWNRWIPSPSDLDWPSLAGYRDAWGMPSFRTVPSGLCSGREFVWRCEWGVRYKGKRVNAEWCTMRDEVSEVVPWLLCACLSSRQLRRRRESMKRAKRAQWVSCYITSWTATRKARKWCYESKTSATRLCTGKRFHFSRVQVGWWIPLL